MSDQLSKVVAEMREKATALAAACEEHKPAKNMGDLALLDVLPAVAETLIDLADRIESAAAPVEVDGLTPYARCVAAINSLDDFARMDTGVDPAGPRAAAFSALDELARQLAESESALAAATRRVAEVEGVVRHHGWLMDHCVRFTVKHPVKHGRVIFDVWPSDATPNVPAAIEAALQQKDNPSD